MSVRNVRFKQQLQGHVTTWQLIKQSNSQKQKVSSYMKTGKRAATARLHSAIMCMWSYNSLS